MFFSRFSVKSPGCDGAGRLERRCGRRRGAAAWATGGAHQGRRAQEEEEQPRRDRRRARLGVRWTTDGAAPRGCRARDARIALWARSRGAALYLLGIYTSTATFFRCACAGAVRVGPSCVHLACMRAVCVSHPLVMGYVSACPDGAPTFLRTGSITIYDIYLCTQPSYPRVLRMGCELWLL